MKRIIFSAALLMAAATLSFAGNPKSEGKSETKSETKTEVKSEVTLFTYYVVGIEGSNYTLSTSPSENCGVTPLSIACEITSTNQITNGLAPISQVEAETNGFDIIDRQPPL